MVSSRLSLSLLTFWQELQKGTEPSRSGIWNHPGCLDFQTKQHEVGFSYSLSFESIVQNLGVSSAVNQCGKVSSPMGVEGNPLQKIHCNSPNLIHFAL